VPHHLMLSPSTTFQLTNRHQQPEHKKKLIQWTFCVQLHKRKFKVRTMHWGYSSGIFNWAGSAYYCTFQLWPGRGHIIPAGPQPNDLCVMSFGIRRLWKKNLRHALVAPAESAPDQKPKEFDGNRWSLYFGKFTLTQNHFISLTSLRYEF
jgi:hypothetical protein